MKPLFLVASAFIACSVLAFGCVTETKIFYVPLEAGEGGSDAEVDGGVFMGCDAQPYDLKGCVCDMPAALRECYQGVPGPKSGCKNTGYQSCELLAGKWGACVGGTKPVADICYDDIDNDCNGNPDDACRCTNDFDICGNDDGGTLAAGPYYTATDPAQPKAGQPFDLFVFSTSGWQNLALFPKPGGCYGGSSQAACASPGAKCMGDAGAGKWNVARFHLTFGAGSYTIEIWSDPGSTPCVGSKIAQRVVVVQ